MLYILYIYIAYQLPTMIFDDHNVLFFIIKSFGDSSAILLLRYSIQLQPTDLHYPPHSHKLSRVSSLWPDPHPCWPHQARSPRHQGSHKQCGFECIHQPSGSTPKVHRPILHEVPNRWPPSRYLWLLRHRKRPHMASVSTMQPMLQTRHPCLWPEKIV